MTYRCTKSGLKQITCPSGLAFDIDKQTCDWKGKVTTCDKLESKFVALKKSAVKEKKNVAMILKFPKICYSINQKKKRNTCLAT